MELADKYQLPTLANRDDTRSAIAAGLKKEVPGSTVGAGEHHLDPSTIPPPLKRMPMRNTSIKILRRCTEM